MLLLLYLFPLCLSLMPGKTRFLSPLMFNFCRSSTAQMSSQSAASASALVSASAVTTASLDISERKRAALFGLYVGDAVAMPVHWMYNLAQLKRDYGRITGYVKPLDSFEGSILNLSNTGGGGRGSDQGDIVGSVILHGKKKFWVRGGNNHYHRGLQAGENTLEAQLARLLTRSITSMGGFSGPDFLAKYVTFMQTPGSHNDTYASTCHRMFFANIVRGKAPEKCADNDGHNTDSIDALTLTVPVIVAYADADREVRNAKVREVVGLIRKSTVLPAYAERYADILTSVLHGTPIRDAISAVEPSLAANIQRTLRGGGGDPMVACYIDSSYPALLFFAYKYGDDLEGAVLASANAGGENVARGGLLGALVGAQHGMGGFGWSRGLREREGVEGEIEGMLGAGVSRL
ncbi:ADP-ribosylglycohydrolase-domain-containing protein [Ochromonadaceae sp. CCMP2298]|nr:ADP-ribosylglycohydrolase-domain-containing protein [Ochromonadaceae sp. CCMP2298]